MFTVKTAICDPETGHAVSHLGHIVVDSGQEFSQMLGVVVPEQMLGNSAVANALDHGGVVARVGKNFAAWKKVKEISLGIRTLIGLPTSCHLTSYS